MLPFRKVNSQNGEGMKNSNENMAQSVHQLRMLLVEKEEEIEVLKKRVKSKGGPDIAAEEKTAPVALTEKLEEYKDTVASLEETVKKLEEKMDAKDRSIASLKEKAARPSPPPSLDGDGRIEESPGEIGRLEKELSQTRAEAARKIEELQDEISGGDLQERLSSAQEELERAENTFQRTKGEYLALSTRNMRLKIGSAVLGLALCVSLVINIKQMRTAHGPGKGMDFITAAGEPLLETGERPSRRQEEDSLTAGEGRPAAGQTISEETHFKYIVKAGDNPSKICKRALGDARLADRVMMENNLKDPRALKVGMTLYLPKEAVKKR